MNLELNRARYLRESKEHAISAKIREREYCLNCSAYILSRRDSPDEIDLYSPSAQHRKNILGGN